MPKIFGDISWEPTIAQRWATAPGEAVNVLRDRRAGLDPPHPLNPTAQIVVERKYDGKRVFIVVDWPEAVVRDRAIQMFSRNWKWIDPGSRFTGDELVKLMTDLKLFMGQLISTQFVIDCELMPDGTLIILDYACIWSKQFIGRFSRMYPDNGTLEKFQLFRMPEEISINYLQTWDSFLSDGIPKDWEGIVVKWIGPTQQEWWKFKSTFHVPCYVIGVVATKSMKYGAFQLATEEGGPLRYVGRVGTGFTEAERQRLGRAAEAGEYPTILVRAMAWTVGGKLREPVYVPGSIRTGVQL